jgi:hypothetical protein
MTIREIIKEKSLKLREISSLGPMQVATELVELTSLLSSLNEYIADKRYWYNVLLEKKMQELGSAAKAKVSAEATQEWKEWNEAVVQKEALEEMIRSLKYFQRAASVEYNEFSK